MLGHHSPSHQWDAHIHHLFLLSPVWVGETSISRKVLRKYLLQHRQAREARVWVKVEDKAHMPGLQTEQTDQSVIQGMFLLSRLWERILFDSSASNSFIVASCVRELGLEIETLEKSLYVSSPLGTKVRVDLMFQDCELEISGILLTMDLRVMDMSKFDVILGMDWLTTYRVVIDCDRRKVTAYT